MEIDNLRQSVMSGLRWSAAMRLLVQVLTWTVTIVVVRLVSPEEYGLAAIAGVVAGYFNLLNEFGLSVALVQKRVDDTATLRCVFGLLLTTGTCFCLVLIGSASAIAQFFSSPSAGPLIRIMSVQFAAMAFCVIPQATLSRQLKFRELSTTNFITSTVGALCTVTLAYLGFGAKALVIGAVTTTVTRAIVINFFAPFLRLPRFDFKRLKSLFSISSQIIVDRSLWYFYTEIDNVVVGRSLGAVSLGTYSLALNIASIPMQRAAEIVNAVALPAYSSVQDDLSRVSSGYLKSLRLGAALSFPVFWGMALVAPALLSVLFGTKWAASVPIIQIICIAMPIRSLGPLAPPVLMAIGKPSTSIRITLWATFIVPTSILIGAYWGLRGVATAWCVAFPLVFLIGSRYITRSLQISYSQIGHALAGPTIAGSIMCGAILLSHLVMVNSPPFITLPLDTVLGAATYFLVLRFAYRQRFDELFEVILGLMGRTARRRP